MSANGTTGTKPTKTGRKSAAPRPRRSGEAKEPDAYEQAHALFEGQAQQWLLYRPDKTMFMPDDLAAVAKLGVPCRVCLLKIYQDRDRGHRLSWTRVPGHWAAGITATCAP